MAVNNQVNPFNLYAFCMTLTSERRNILGLLSSVIVRFNLLSVIELYYHDRCAAKQMKSLTEKKHCGKKV